MTFEPGAAIQVQREGDGSCGEGGSSESTGCFGLLERHRRVWLKQIIVRAGGAAFVLLPTMKAYASGPLDIEQEFNRLLLWGAAVAAAVLLLFVIQKAVRYFCQTRIRSIIREPGIRMDDLDRMARTGLLSDEEKLKVKQAIVRSMTQVSQEAIASRLDSQTPESPLSENPPIDSSKPVNFFPPKVVLRKSVSNVDASPPISTSQSQTPPGTNSQPPVDLDSLLARGLLTPEEYETLKKNT